MKDSLSEIRSNLQGNNNRVNEAENQINDLEHKEAKNDQSEQQEEKKNPKKKKKKNEDSVSSPWDTFKRSNICLIGVPEKEEKGQEIRNLSEKNSERKLP